MIRSDRLDREILLRQDALDLLDPLPPRLLAPEVVHPDEAALEQVLAQPLHLLVAEPRGADVLHLDKRALEQLVVGEPDDEVIRLAVAGLADAGLGQLGEPDREVDVGRGVIRPPALAACLTAIAVIHAAAEIEVAVEAVSGGKARLGPAEAAAPEPAQILRGHGGRERDRDERRGEGSAWNVSQHYSRFAVRGFAARGLAVRRNPEGFPNCEPANARTATGYFFGCSGP